MAEKCPICGDEAKPGSIWKICPKRSGEAICIECCKACEHYFKNEVYISHGCRYQRETVLNETEEKKKDLARIEARIQSLDEKEAYFYRRDLPKVAQKINIEIRSLQRKAAKLREELKK